MNIRSEIYRLSVFILVVANGFLLIEAMAGEKNDKYNWPRFRGPEGTGISKEEGLLERWPEGGPEELWRIPIGVGYSGMAVSDKRVYLLDSDEDSEFLLCLDAKNGERLWQRRAGPLYTGGYGYGAGPRSTPTIDGEVVYALTASGNLVAASASDGKILWSLDLKNEFGFREPEYWWGYCMSPFIEGELLLLQAGGTGNNSIVALNKNSGKVVWTCHSDFQAYSTPILIDFDGERQFVFVTAQNVVAVSPSGEIHWNYPWGGSNIKVAMPILVPPDKIFVSAAYGIGAVLLQMKQSGDSTTVSEVWQSKVMNNHFHTSILLGQHIYGFDNGTLKCIEVATGQQLWAKRGLGKGSLIYADGHLIVLSDRGKLVLVEANPNQYFEKSSVQVLRGRCWTPPTLAGGKLFLRNQKEMICLNIEKQTP